MSETETNLEEMQDFSATPEAKTPSETIFTPENEQALRKKLDECGVNYSKFADDADRGPARLFEELRSGKNSLAIRTTETGEKEAVRKSRVFRARLTTEIDGQKYEFQLAKKISRKDGSVVEVTGDEAVYASSKGLKADQQPEDVLLNVVQEDLGESVVVNNSNLTSTHTELREANPSSKMPWINSEYDFYTYDVQVDVPEESIKEETVSEGRAWDTVRVAVPVN